MHLLIIGGTVFLGRHFVSEAVAAGHQVTVLNRGSQAIPEHSSIEKLVADREKNLDVLTGRSFDVVIDTCGYVPEVVAKSVTALKASIGSYVFISSVSAYGEFKKIGITERDPVKQTAAGEAGDYGSLKADCEAVVTKLMPEGAIIVRPGLIVGPYDPTDRFTYWPTRVAQGGEILAPGRRDRAIQFIDVRDLSAWIIKFIGAHKTGLFNAKGPLETAQQKLTMGDFLETCKQTLTADCKFVWGDDETLLELAVPPWTGLPLWLPDSNVSFAGFMRLDCSKAFDAGLRTRPIAETIMDTLTWDRTRDPKHPRKAGLAAEREKEIVSQLKNSLRS